MWKEKKKIKHEYQMIKLDYSKRQIKPKFKMELLLKNVIFIELPRRKIYIIIIYFTF